MQVRAARGWAGNRDPKVSHRSSPPSLGAEALGRKGDFVLSVSLPACVSRTATVDPLAGRTGLCWSAAVECVGRAACLSLSRLLHTQTCIHFLIPTALETPTLTGPIALSGAAGRASPTRSWTASGSGVNVSCLAPG